MPSTDSDVETGSTTLVGLWIHDPLNPAGTARNYIYGRSSRSVGINVAQQGMRFAGRTYPVVDFSEHQEDNFSVTIPIPEGPTWSSELADLAAFAELRRVLCFRDNRGRLFFGTMNGYKEDDQDWGTQVSFNVNRVDYDEGEEVTI